MSRARHKRDRKAVVGNGTRNELLARLPADEYARLSKSLTEVQLNFKEPIAAQDRRVEQVFFPESAVISFVSDLTEGGRIETGTVGNDGFGDVSGFLGLPHAFGTAFCQIPGKAYRVKQDVIWQERERNSPLARLMMRYVGVFTAMIAQGAACNRAHSVAERTARWLLMTHDRVNGDEFPLTQEFLAQMVGVRRPTLNVAGLALQQAGLIRYSRGKIRITNRKGLQAASCECYAQVRKQFADAFGT